MKALIIIALFVALWLIVRALIGQYQSAQRDEQGLPPAPAQQAPASATLTGLPPNLEDALAAAEKQGAAGLGNFLAVNRRFIRDPRLAAIELDYVVLVARQDPDEAKRIFDAVKARVTPNSPLYDRVKRLEKTFQ